MKEISIETQNYLLRSALHYLIWTKEFKDNNGKSEAYQKHREKAWKKANEVMKVINGDEVFECNHPFDKVISVGTNHNCTLCGKNL